MDLSGLDWEAARAIRSSPATEVMHSTCINVGDSFPEPLHDPDVSPRVVKREMRVARHSRSMAWQSFEVTQDNVRAARGFALIGRLARRRRERLGLSQRQLELLCGVDQTVISRLENGRLGGLRWSRFAELVDALGGIGEMDPHPAWTARFLPPGAGHDRDPMRGHQTPATARIVERREGDPAVSRSPARPSANVGQ
jgi:hypothetical protein